MKYSLKKQGLAINYCYGDIPLGITAWTISDIINSDCLDKRVKRV